MLFKCYHCGIYSFEEICPRCGDEFINLYVPLDPKYYREFKYTSQGFVKDLLFKKSTEQKLSEKLQSVLEKYNKFKHPYFVNYLHIARNSVNQVESGTIDKFSDQRLTLFHHVLTRLGFDELNEYPQLTRKLIMSTDFDFRYSNFTSQIINHIKESLVVSAKSWIEERGALFRKELPLFLYYVWENNLFSNEITFGQQNTGELIPLVSQNRLIRFQESFEKLFLDIQITRFQAILERFNPQDYINIYRVDAMDGYEFEKFLSHLFSILGYDVEETRKSKDQGADLFVKRFGTKIVIQAKNYTDNVGNSAIQQAIAAKAFYDCDEAMVVTNSYFTSSAKELAENTDVKLVDRDELINYIDEYNQSIIEQRSHEQDSATPIEGDEG